MVCKTCGCENHDGSIYCRTCGAKLYQVRSVGNTIYIDDCELEMIHVSGGSFMMGNEKGVLLEHYTLHCVTLDDYFICATPVTQRLWFIIMGPDNPKLYNNISPDFPIHSVSWNLCMEFILKLHEITDMNFRMPTEAEWEYAAKGGNLSRGYKYSGGNRLSKVGIRSLWTGKLEPVRLKLPNELGIYDMSGGVWEWCSDWYGDYSSSNASNPKGPKSGEYKVQRGGSYLSDEECCRPYYREHDFPESGTNCGLRLAL